MNFHVRSTSVPAEQIIDLIERRGRTERMNMKRTMKHEGYLLHKAWQIPWSREHWRSGSGWNGQWVPMGSMNFGSHLISFDYIVLTLWRYELSLPPELLPIAMGNLWPARLRQKCKWFGRSWRRGPRIPFWVFERSFWWFQAGRFPFQNGVIQNISVKWLQKVWNN